MNNLDITTHIESLDSEHVVIPDLDIDAALASTVERGKKLSRDRKITKALQASVVLALIFLLGAGAIRIFNDSPTSTVATKKLEKVPTKVLANEEASVPQSVSVPAQTPETTIAPLPAPANISFGDPAVCVIPSTPGDDGIDIGSSQTAEKWSPTINETKTISIGENGKQITLKNVVNSEASTGQSATLVGDVDQTDSFADINAQNFTYCTVGYNLAITQESNGSYILNSIMR